MKNSFLILGFLISLLISCPPPTPEPGPDEGGNGSGNETAKEFTVSFDANGGTGTIAPMKVKAGTVITLPSADGLSRQYYIFTQWETGGKHYNPGDDFTVKADTVFSAAWSHNWVSITYDSNDDTIPDPDPQWVYAGSDLILPGNPFGSSPDGKYFHGWTTTAPTTEDNILAPGSTFPVEETDLTFYAYWGDTSVDEYTVTFHGTEMEQIAFNKYTEEISLPLYTGEPGIICKGWDTDAAAANVVYEDGGIIPKEALTGNIVLYPILEDVRVTLTWEKNGNVVSPDDSTAFPDRVAPGDFFFMSYAVTKDSGDGKVWILDSVTAKTVSGKTVPTQKEMMDGIAEVWRISVPAEATVITLNWKELTQLTVSTLTVYNPYEYYSNETIISFEFLYSANSDPKTENLKITKDGKEVEIRSYHYEFYTAEEKIGVCELSAAEGAGNYQLQIVHKGNVVKEAAFTVENKGERTFTPTAGKPTQNTSGQWVIPVSFVFSNIDGPGWLDYNVFLNDAQEELTEYTDYDTTISDTNMDFTFTDSVTIQKGNKIRIIFTYDRSSPIQTKSVEVTIPTPPVPGPDEGGSGSGDGTKKEFTVSFDTGDGTGTVAPMTAEAGTAITLPSADGLSRQYYTFTAWETGGKQYNPDDEFTVNADTVFTAVWTRNTITVTYEANHESVTSSPHTATVNAGENFPLLENPFSNSPDGQIFYGWALTENPQESEILKPNADFFADEANITFYAVWKSSSEVVSLTWNKNGAEILNPDLGEADLFPTTLTSDTTFTFPAYAVTKKPASGANPFRLTGLTVTTADGETVSVSEQTNSESGLSEWSFTTGSENLNITLNWEEVIYPSVTISQIRPTYNPGAMNVALTYLSCDFNPYPEMFSLYEYQSEKGEYELVAADYRFSALDNGEYVFVINWSETITGREHYYKVYAKTGSRSKEKTFFLEPPKIALTYIKNGAEVPPAYEDYTLPKTAYYEETLQIFQLQFYKNDGTDTPWILSGIRVTETDNPSVTLTVTSGNEEEVGSYWEYTAGDKPLTIELLWDKQSISNPSFEVDSSSDKNSLGVACQTDIALSPGMITVTDGNDNPLTPSQIVTTCVQIVDGIRSYYCYIEFAENIPDGTYKVIFTVSDQIIHTETITVPDTVPEPQP